MLISFHLPKAAGISFYNALSDHFKDQIIRDYSDYPMNTPVFRRNLNAAAKSIKYKFDSLQPQCVHGHFLPLKYRFIKTLPKAKFVTWMRDPAERIASQYYYMIREYNPDKAKNQPLFKRVIDEQWTLEQYCLSKEFQNTCSQFLWRFPVSKFDFIGIVEDYDNELNYFSSKFLGKQLRSYQENCNPVQHNTYFEDKKFKERVLQYHSKDVELYKFALHAYKKRAIEMTLSNKTLFK